MAHAKPSELKDIAPLLEELRTIPALKEKSHGCFYLKSKAVLHFHVEKERRYAHVFDGKLWHKLDILAEPTESKIKSHLKRIAKLLFLP